MRGHGQRKQAVTRRRLQAQVRRWSGQLASVGALIRRFSRRTTADSLTQPSIPAPPPPSKKSKKGTGAACIACAQTDEPTPHGCTETATSSAESSSAEGSSSTGAKKLKSSNNRMCGAVAAQEVGLSAVPSVRRPLEGKGQGAEKVRGPTAHPLFSSHFPTCFPPFPLHVPDVFPHVFLLCFAQ